MYDNFEQTNHLKKHLFFLFFIQIDLIFKKIYQEIDLLDYN
jgi:hypothetical protein